MAESKPSDWSDLHWAVWTQDLDSVKQILSTAPAAAHAEDDLGWTPLHLACCSNTSRLWQTAQLEPRGLNGSAGIGSILTSRPGASERYKVLAYTYSRSNGLSDDVGLGSGNVAEPSVSFSIALELLHAGAVVNTQGRHPPLHCAASSGWPDHLDALTTPSATEWRSSTSRRAWDPGAGSSL
ncbi:hypothetical protein MAPG_10684 [Magnaporthiopsis poae ATCC 64411]|uniref:Uncharacterized protein n=1 Tax=Magnaporthiopsis poae (strain ATCC 64411 / 73-15) TaxID=644358 RepID=A0A0C4ED90_MAGP6|nr:hypothetical protein MAPG_10684 [Magnaporthiopsis poae ATCC 64411]